MQPDLDLLAKANFFNLSGNPYPGRGIVVGLDETDKYLVQVYWIMGRSENSRNRVFSADDRRVYTEAADPSKVKDPSLIIYNAMLQSDGCYIVSNGDQTDTILELQPRYDWGPGDIDFALESREYEPDAPNYTQRITAVCSIVAGHPAFIQMSILRKSMFDSGCDRLAYFYDNLRSGLGFCITTYSGDGDPLPAFRGDPLLMPLVGGIKVIAQAYWAALNEANRVSLVVKFIDKMTGESRVHIINKYEKAAP